MICGRVLSFELYDASLISVTVPISACFCQVMFASFCIKHAGRLRLFVFLPGSVWHVMFYACMLFGLFLVLLPYKLWSLSLKRHVNPYFQLNWWKKCQFN